MTIYAINIDECEDRGWDSLCDNNSIMANHCYDSKVKAQIGVENLIKNGLEQGFKLSNGYTLTIEDVDDGYYCRIKYTIVEIEVH